MIASMRIFRIICFFALALGVIAQSNELERLSIKPPYINHGMRSLWWEYGGSTIIDKKNGIFLTQDLQHQSGWLSTRLPTPTSSFEVLFQFRVSSESRNLFGDGMGLFLTEERAKTGPVFGFTDKFNGYGIFFDTYNNDRPGTVFPRVVVMKGDGKTSYDIDHDGKANEIEGCSALHLHSTDYTLGKLKFDKNAKKLRLELAFDASSDFIKCFELDDVDMPATAFLSFSARTGELSENHEIHSITSRTITNIDDEFTPEFSKEELKGSTTKRSPWKRRFIFVLISLIVVFSVFSLRSYQQKQEKIRRSPVL
ncbi:lectin family glycoprotein receptor [Schizosaccharomyces cryophilus OY26]|uniref:Lectin family glycoprotein receptor n=1 Tax=Schizosaccharomyces cryophilus (strain OY26 / ATCC MYA-4695 / CBS 11777 / NBRC 106824 / NRRL Y48691) TaxID=653667 RepID=S9VZM2_SCHCR|nr:lectin family glycoprotein receptor [Schizosaccharomyces cryophilus OY26]EPY51270.1 lectin family glycoprotein receptor [Schizosaccharomyces cryophilus OY26]